MKRHLTLALAALYAAVMVAPLAAQNLLVNPGFEGLITSDGPPYVGFWESFRGPGLTAAGNGSVAPRNGASHAQLSIFVSENSFAGVFQDVTGLIPGQTRTFSIWHRSFNDSLDAGVEMRIEWRDSVGNTEISRTPNLTTKPGASYSLISLTADVPSGADSARVLYEIQTFGSEPGNTGIVYLDDASFTVGLPGDYNQNEEIDSADYTVWRDAMTDGSTSLLNDSTPGAVDESDFIYWRNHFGESLGSGFAAGAAVSVPEPNSFLLLCIGALGVAALRKARSTMLT